MASVSGVYFVGIWNGFWSGGFSPIAILFPKCLSLIALNLSCGARNVCKTKEAKKSCLFVIIRLKSILIERVDSQAGVHHDSDGVQTPSPRDRPITLAFIQFTPYPKGHPCAPGINRLNGHNRRLNEHNRCVPATTARRPI